MVIEKMFETAARGKVRFYYKGVLSTEDIYDLSMVEINEIYQELNRELKSMEVDSLIGQHADNEILKLKIAILKYVFDTKKAKRKEIEDSQARKAKKQKLLEIMARYRP